MSTQPALTSTTAQPIGTPIATNLRQQLQVGSAGRNDPLTANLLNVIEQLERSRNETDARLTALNNRVTQLTAGTVHYCDHCILNRTLCCLGISPCKPPTIQNARISLSSVPGR